MRDHSKLQMLAIITVVWAVIFALYCSLYRNTCHQANYVIVAMTIVLLLAFLAKAFGWGKHENLLESFEEDIGISTLEGEEDLTFVNSLNPTIYLTIFTTMSYDYGSSRFVWKNIAPLSNTSKCQNRQEFFFTKEPVFLLPEGISMGETGIKGPLSNSLGISMSENFTIAFVFINNIPTNATNAENIEILKLWANTPNNNGLSLFIEKNTIRLHNGSYQGKLMLQFGNLPPKQCKMWPEDQLFTFNTDFASTKLFIVKELQDVKVYYTVSTGTHPPKLICNIDNVNINNKDPPNFSNKNMFINYNSNWRANMLSFMAVSNVMSDLQMMMFVNHIHTTHLMVANARINNMKDSYKDIVNSQKCPYPEKVCKECQIDLSKEKGPINPWDFSILRTSSKCRSALKDHCIASIGKANAPSICACFDPSSPDYQSSGCKFVRNTFDPEQQKKEEAKIIKQHNLVPRESCRFGGKKMKVTLSPNNYVDMYRLDDILIKIRNTFPAKKCKAD